MSKKIVTFVGTPSGDCECFCWDDVPIVQRAGLCATHTLDVEHGERLDRVYPGDVMEALGCRHGVRYRFTVSAELIEGAEHAQ